MCRSHQCLCRRMSRSCFVPSQSWTLAADTTRPPGSSQGFPPGGDACAPGAVCPRRRRGSPFFGRLDRLTIETPSAGLATLAGGHPDIATEQIMHPLPGTVLPPAPELLIDNLPGRKVVGQQAPRTTTTEDREDRLQDFTLWRFLGPPTGLGWGDQMLTQVANSTCYRP
jgi:hypothetical protein